MNDRKRLQLAPAGPAAPLAGGARLERRDLGRLLVAGAALGGLGACGQRPQERILPFVERPRELTPGLPLHYATSLVLDGFATGLLAVAREGRPIKLEGNPQHPASLGATGVHEQAAVLDLYDPGRLSAPRYADAPASWERALAALRAAVHDGSPPWIVSYPESSPSFAEQVRTLRERVPSARFVFDTPFDRRALYGASSAVFGRPLELHYAFERAAVVLSLDADFTCTMPMSVRYAREFARRRSPEAQGGMNRLYAVETMLTPTGSLADHRLPVRPSELGPIARALLAELARLGHSPPGLPELRSPLPEGFRHAEFVRKVAADLARARGAALVVVGPAEPRELHLLGHALNAALGAFGRTLALTEPALLEPEGGDSLADLVEGLRAQEVRTVIVLGANPVHTAPPELELARWLARAPNTFHLTHTENETSAACRWRLPAAHFLESWGDARAYDGTESFIQPLLVPRWPALAPLELLAEAAGTPRARGYGLVRESFRRRRAAASDFERLWAESVQLGLVEGSALPSVDASPRWEAVRAVLDAPAAPGHALELHLAPSPAVHDGRFAENPWLLELPHPVTKQSWGNAAIFGARTARELGVETGRVVELGLHGRRLLAPALVLPGHADGAVTLELGYGRSVATLFGEPVGVDGFALRTARARLAPGPLGVRATEARDEPVLTQEHWQLERRPIALAATLAEYRKNPDFTAELRGETHSLLPAYRYQGVQWAMTIDTSICNGCSACVIACQAENNTPSVGKAGVARSREMHWLRIDRYFVGPSDAPAVIHQPMLCQHCEKAPCEYPCPVNATVHSPDGLNEMVYNRCIGTRFCSNNCPYKVRRFNWFEYGEDQGTRALQKNPDVTVRERGVMEKCTYCVQRIRRAEIRARTERRSLEAGEVVTACQQACASGAIQFGSLTHTESAMVRLRREPRRYAVLHDLGTRPRNLYLAKITNPND